MITTGTSVAVFAGAEVSVGKGMDVGMLTGGWVAARPRFPLKRKNPPAKAAIAMTGRIRNNGLNAFFAGVLGTACALAFTVGATCSFVVTPRFASRNALVISAAVEKR